MLSRIFASLFLFLSGVSISDCALSADGGNDRIESNISNINVSGPQALLPGFEGEYVLSWAGGQAPFTAVLAEEPCPGGISSCGPGVTIFGQISAINERQIAFGARVEEPQIARLFGTIIDANGVAVTSAPLNVRVGTDSRYFISSYDYVDFNENGCSARRHFSPASLEEFDPNESFIRITDENAEGLPVFSWNVISQPSQTDSIAATFEVRAGFSNTLFELEDDGGAAGILPPLAYGDYTHPGTVPFGDPPIPAPPLPVATRMTTGVLTFGGGCAPTHWYMVFALNPPEAGSPVLLQGPADALDMQDPDPTLGETLDRQRRIRLEREEAAIAACVNEALTYTVIAFIAGRGRSNQVFGLLEELTFEIVTDTEVRDKLRAKCAATAAPQAIETDDVADRGNAKTTTPDFDLEVVSGSGRVTLPDATTVSEIRTAHARVIVSGGALAIDIAQTADGQRSTIGSQDSSLLVMPNNPALPETSVPPGFFVILSDTSISTPNEFAMFADGFE